jgi:hypothetical protein
LINKKKNIEAGWNKRTHNDVQTAPVINTNEEFNKRKAESIDLSRTSSIRGAGRLVTEKVLQASRDEHEYFKKTNKIFTKEAIKESVYKR